MESDIKIKVPQKQLLDKKNYEPLLLECLNCTPFFIEKSADGFSAPESESNSQCDAIANSGCYCIDYKLLVSQEGAQNMNDTSLDEVTICKGVTEMVASKASRRGESSLQIPFLWGFLITRSVALNENYEFVLSDKADEHMEKTIDSLNRMIKTKKNLLFFHPNELAIQCGHDNPIDVLCHRAKDVFSDVSKARRWLSPGYETYYALWMNNMLILLSEDFAHIGCVELTSLDAWHKLHIKL